jgi:putative chitinase
MITTQQFKTLFPRAQDHQGWVTSMNSVFPTYEINTPRRIAAFLAQCGHESGGWTVFEENLNYSAQGLVGIFKKYFPTLESAQPYARQPQKIANRVYGGRMGNGPEASGDGWKYRGRGPIQLTGKDNYRAFAKDMFEDWENLFNNPDWVTSDRDFALMSAIWFWNKNGLNKWADASDSAESAAFITLTKRINGGTIGLDCRQKHFKEAMAELT